MLEKILNLEGVVSLTKTQQRNVNGGGYCKLTTFTNGQSEVSFIFGLPDDPSSQTSSAENACGQLLSGGADRCFYDCSHDGPGFY